MTFTAAAVVAIMALGSVITRQDRAIPDSSGSAVSQTQRPAVSQPQPPASGSPVADPYRTCPATAAEARRTPAGAFMLRPDIAGPCNTRHEATDASIAAGNSEVLVATNDAFALYEKGGALIEQMPSLQMFSTVVDPAGYGWGDPRVLFDRQAQRYFLAFTLRKSVPAQGLCHCDLRWLLAVSRASAPRSLRPEDWYLYSFDGTVERGRPSATGDGDFLVMATDARNLVLHAQSSSAPSSEEPFTKLWVFDKAKLLSGTAVTVPDREFLDVRDVQTGRPLLRILPTAMADDPGRIFLVGRGSDTRSCSLVVGAISGPAARAELVLKSVPVPGACPWPQHSVQRGGGTPLISFGDVMAQPSYAAGRIWLTHAIADQVSSAGSFGAARVVELDVSRWPETPTVLTDTRLAERGVWYSYPALAANARGDVAIVASRSSFTEYASVWVTGRLATDPRSALRPPVLVKRGHANLNQVIRASQPNGSSFNKFADFAGASLDPQDGTAWLIGTYAANVCTTATWVAHVDWTTATDDVGSEADAGPLVMGPPCPTNTKGLFTIRLDGAGDVPLPEGAPVGARAYRFTYVNADLADPSAGIAIEAPTTLGWRIDAPGTLIVFIARETIPGSYQLRVALRDGRSTGASFTIAPP